MNSKALIFGGLIAGVGFIVWRMMNSAQTGAFSTMPNMGQGTFSTQPSNVYPFQANEPPRVDNSNQPWYGGDRTALMQGNPQLANLADNALAVKSISSIVSSATSMWDDLGVSDWFSSGTPSGGSTDNTDRSGGYLGGWDLGFN